MENLSMEQVRDFMIVLVALLAFGVLLGNFIKTIKGWKQPHDDLEAWRQDVNGKLDRDNRRLNDLEEGNRVICRGILALLSHEISGNSDDKLKESQAEITNYLIER